MKINRPVPCLADGGTDLAAILRSPFHHPAGIKYPITRVGYRRAESAKSRLQAGFGSLSQGTMPGVAGRITLDIIASQASQQLINRRLEPFAFDIPQRQVESA